MTGEEAIFYVYEHWRPDKDVCFYVGKGHGNRAWTMRCRNRHHRHITATLKKLSLMVDVRIVADGFTEPEALRAEIDRIAFWRAAGAELVNITDGGDGVCGLKHSAETRAKMSEKASARKREPHSEETKRKIGEANRIALKGKKNPEHSARLKGRKLSAEHRAALSAGAIGRVVSEETRAKLRASNIGQTRSVEACEHMSASHLGKRPTLETRLKRAQSMREAWARRKANEVARCPT